MGWLNRIVDNGRHLISQAIEVDLVAHFGREVSDRLLSVVLTSVELAVDESLYAISGGTKQPCYRESGCRHHEVFSTRIVLHLAERCSVWGIHDTHPVKPPGTSTTGSPSPLISCESARGSIFPPFDQ
jgi:hypothetical protein